MDPTPGPCFADYLRAALGEAAWGPFAIRGGVTTDVYGVTFFCCLLRFGGPGPQYRTCDFCSCAQSARRSPQNDVWGLGRRINGEHRYNVRRSFDRCRELLQGKA